MEDQENANKLSGQNIDEIQYGLSKNDARLDKYRRQMAIIQSKMDNINRKEATETNRFELHELGQEWARLLDKKCAMDHQWRWWRAQRLNDNYRIMAADLIEQAIAEGWPDPIEVNVSKIIYPESQIAIGIVTSDHYYQESGSPLNNADYILVCEKPLWIPTGYYSWHGTAALKDIRSQFSAEKEAPPTSTSKISHTYILGSQDAIVLPAKNVGFLISNMQTGKKTIIRGGVEKFDEFAQKIQDLTGCNQAKCARDFDDFVHKSTKQRFFPGYGDGFVTRGLKFCMRQWLDLNYFRHRKFNRNL